MAGHTGRRGEPDTGSSGQATIADFERIEIRAGVVTRAEPFPEARKPAYRIWVDFGPLGVKRSSAQLTALYRPEDLVGRTVLAVTNLPPRQIATFTSEVLILGVPSAAGEEVALIGPDRPVEPGRRVF